MQIFVVGLVLRERRFIVVPPAGLVELDMTRHQRLLRSGGMKSGVSATERQG